MTDESRELMTVEEHLDQPNDEDVCRKVRSYFSEAQAARQMKDQLFMELYRIYRFFAKKRKFPWRANIYIPVGHLNVVTKTARLLTAVLASDPFFKAVAENPVFRPNEEPVETLLRSQHEDMELPIVFHDWFQDMYIFPVGILKMYWKYEEEVDEETQMVERPIYVKVGDGYMDAGSEMVSKKVKSYTTTYDGPCAEVVNIFDFYPDPKATDLKNARYVIHRKDVTIDELERKARQGIYDKKAVARIKDMQATGGKKSQEKVELEMIDKTMPDKEADIELLECHTKSQIITIVDEIKLADRPKKIKGYPFFVIKHLRNAHRFYGIALNEPIITIQNAINDTNNIRFDNWKLVVQKMLGVDESAIKYPSDLVSRPGAIVRFKGGTNISQAFMDITPGTLPADAYVEQDRLMHTNEIVTGVSEPQSVASSAQVDETATASRMKGAATNTRDGVTLITIEPVIKAMLQYQLALNQEYLDYDRQLQVDGPTGRQYPTVGPQQIQGKMRFRFQLSPIQGNKEVWLQRLLLVGNTFMKIPPLAMGTNWMEWGKRIMKAAEERNPELLVPGIPPDVMQAMFMMQQTGQMPPEMMAMMQSGQMPPQMMQMMMQMMGGGGMGMGGQGMVGPGEATAMNPEAGRMNAKMRAPQPTPKDMYRDMFAKVQ